MSGSDPTQASQPQTRIFEAFLASGISGLVECGKELTENEAVERRRNGLDIVVCGVRGRANRSVAYRIEAAVGVPTKPQRPEPKAGPYALPHYHQRTRDPKGHSFHETDNLKAKKAS